MLRVSPSFGSIYAVCSGQVTVKVACIAVEKQLILVSTVILVPEASISLIANVTITDSLIQTCDWLLMFSTNAPLFPHPRYYLITTFQHNPII
jgi:hypothetical protein